MKNAEKAARSLFSSAVIIPSAPPSPLLTPMFRFRPNRNYVPSLVEFRVQTLPSKASNELNIACQRRTTLHRSSSIFHVWQYVVNFKKSSRKNNLQKLLCPSYETFVNSDRIQRFTPTIDPILLKRVRNAI